MKKRVPKSSPLLDAVKEETEDVSSDACAPLALRLRPKTPDEFVGQQHFFGPGKLLRRMLEADRISSLIFYGPPGTGKTSLAHVIAHTTQARFHELNAASATVADVRRVLDVARQRRKRSGQRTILFIDELHRFNRAQQDVLLPDVESGTIILIGATTHNPFFALNSPLISRSQIFEFKPLEDDELRTLLARGVAFLEQETGNRIEVTNEASDHLCNMSDGDARRLLNALELGVLSTPPDDHGVIHYDLPTAEESIQRKAIVYDADEDAHYDTASAFIKSMRGSDPDAALYWMVKMLEAGEDPRFIARRVVIAAAEDVGNADPYALPLAIAAMHAVEFVGMPECRIPLAQAVTYIACAPKSNASYMALEKATEDVKSGRTLDVPEYLRDASYKGAKRLGHGQGYKYAHSFPDHWVDQDYLPAQRIYYRPTNQGYEKEMLRRLSAIRKKRSARKSENESGPSTRGRDSDGPNSPAND